MKDETNETELKEHRWRDAMELTANDRGDFKVEKMLEIHR